MADALAHVLLTLCSYSDLRSIKTITKDWLWWCHNSSVGSWELFTLCHFTLMKHLQVMLANVTFKLLTDHQISRLPTQLLLLTLCGEFRRRVAHRSYPCLKLLLHYNVTVRISLVAGIDPLVEHRSDLDRYWNIFLKNVAKWCAINKIIMLCGRKNALLLSLSIILWHCVIYTNLDVTRCYNDAKFEIGATGWLANYVSCIESHCHIDMVLSHTSVLIKHKTTAMNACVVTQDAPLSI